MRIMPLQNRVMIKETWRLSGKQAHRASCCPRGTSCCPETVISMCKISKPSPLGGMGLALGFTVPPAIIRNQNTSSSHTGGTGRCIRYTFFVLLPAKQYYCLFIKSINQQSRRHTEGLNGDAGVERLRMSAPIQLSVLREGSTDLHV